MQRQIKRNKRRRVILFSKVLSAGSFFPFNIIYSQVRSNSFKKIELYDQGYSSSLIVFCSLTTIEYRTQSKLMQIRCMLPSKIRFSCSQIHDRTENACTVSTSLVPYKALEKFSKALYGTTGGTYSARIFRPVMTYPTYFLYDPACEIVNVRLSRNVLFMRIF